MLHLILCYSTHLHGRCFRSVGPQRGRLESESLRDVSRGDCRRGCFRGPSHQREVKATEEIPHTVRRPTGLDSPRKEQNDMPPQRQVQNTTQEKMVSSKRYIFAFHCSCNKPFNQKSLGNDNLSPNCIASARYLLLLISYLYRSFIFPLI